MSETVKTSAAGTTQEQVTEEDLKKSLATLEGKTEKAAATAEPKVVTAPTVKTTAAAVQELATTDLKKSLEVSDVLKEFANVIGLHNDAAIETLQKSVQNGAERDFAMIRILTELKKSMDERLTKVEEAVVKFGEKPAAAAGAVAVTATTEQVLQKTAGAAGGKTVTDQGKNLTRKQVLVTLEKMAKATEPMSQDSMRYIHAATKFESTGAIDDAILIDIVQNMKKAAA